MKKLISLLVVPLFMSGCETAIKHGDIIAIKQRAFGIVVETVNPSSQSPDIKVGFVSTVIQFIPTSTTGPINAPRYADSLELQHSANPFQSGIVETTGSGDVLLGSGTNTVSEAILPKEPIRYGARPLAPPIKRRNLRFNPE